MPIPLHLWLKDSSGSDIRGSSQVEGREGSIEVLSFTHGMISPADGVTGKLLGNRMHWPLMVEKEIDRSSPVLYMALSRCHTLKSAEIKWYRVDDSGREIEYFNMMMRNVKIVAVTPRVSNIKDSSSRPITTLSRLSCATRRSRGPIWMEICSIEMLGVMARANAIPIPLFLRSTLCGMSKS